MQETLFNSWVGKIHWRRDRLPTPEFWPGEFHRLYSPWGCKELDMTERLSVSLIDFSGGRSPPEPRSSALQADSLPAEPQGKLKRKFSWCQIKACLSLESSHLELMKI